MFNVISPHCPSNDEWINVVYPYTGILFGSKRKWSTDTCCNTSEPWKHYAEWKKAVRKGHLYKMSGIGKFIETKYVVVA